MSTPYINMPELIDKYPWRVVIDIDRWDSLACPCMNINEVRKKMLELREEYYSSILEKNNSMKCTIEYKFKIVATYDLKNLKRINTCDYIFCPYCGKRMKRKENDESTSI